MAWQTINIRPGIITGESESSVAGRVISMQNCRFYKGKLEKLGGWVRFGADAIVGLVRGAHNWNDHSGKAHIILGCQNRVYAKTKELDAVEVTPQLVPRAVWPVTHGAVFQSGSVQVGFAVADEDDQALFNKYLKNGVRVKAEYYDASGNFVFEADDIVSNVSAPYRLVNTVGLNYSFHSTVTRGDSAPKSTDDLKLLRVFITVYMPEGLLDINTQSGWGTGFYGSGSWGSERSVIQDLERALPRVWSFGTYGQTVLAMCGASDLFLYDPTHDDPRLRLVPNAPAGNFVFVTSERYPIVLGRYDDSFDDPMYISWPHQGTIDNWDYTNTESTANLRRIQHGNLLVAGASISKSLNLLWSDTALYQMQFIGGAYQYSTIPIAEENAGLIAPQAFANAQAIVYYMSTSNFYRTNGQSLEMLPNQNDVREHVFGRLNELNAWKNFCYHNRYYNEIWFWYCVGDEPDNFAVFHMDTNTWSTGEMVRTAATDLSIESDTPVMCGHNSERNMTMLYRHEFDSAGIKLLNADGVPLTWSFRTARGGIANMTRMLDILSFQPDFQTLAGNITVTLRGYNYANSKRLDDQEGIDDDPSQPKVEFIINSEKDRDDCRFNARTVSLEMKGEDMDGDFRLGEVMFDIMGRATRQ